MRDYRGRKRGQRGLLFALVLCLLVSVLGACKGAEVSEKVEDVAGYTQAQAMVVLASERNRYQNIYTDQIWNTKVEGQDDENFGVYYLARMKDFLQNIKTLNLLAAERGVEASSAEKTAIAQLAEAFYEGLNDADLRYMASCTFDDVKYMYTEYFVACKMAENLLSGVKTEVSDADAKVIRVAQIEVSDRAQAEQLAQDVLLAGANFDYYIRQYSESTQTEVTLARGAADNAYTQAAFALEQDAISGVVEQDGKYYILKCLDAYDEAATRSRKADLEQAIRTAAFQKSFEAYASAHVVRFADAFWESIDLSAEPESTADNFFSLYDDYFGSDS